MSAYAFWLIHPVCHHSDRWNHDTACLLSPRCVHIHSHSLNYLRKAIYCDWVSEKHGFASSAVGFPCTARCRTRTERWKYVAWRDLWPHVPSRKKCKMFQILSHLRYLFWNALWRNQFRSVSRGVVKKKNCKYEQYLPNDVTFLPCLWQQPSTAWWKLFAPVRRPSGLWDSRVRFWGFVAVFWTRRSHTRVHGASSNSETLAWFHSFLFFVFFFSSIQMLLPAWINSWFEY